MTILRIVLKMRYKTILGLLAVVGTLSIFEIRSEQLDSAETKTSVCEANWVVEKSLPKAVIDHFKTVGVKLKSSGLKITNVSESPVSHGDIVLCHAGLQYAEHKVVDERYLVDFIINQSNGQQTVTVNRINYL